VRIVGFAAFLLLIGTGCSRTISVELPPQRLTLVVYAQGQAVQRCAIAPGSEKFLKLNELLKQSAAGWHHPSAGYVPALAVIGSDTNLYFTEESLIMSYSGGEYAHAVSADSHAFLKCP
jgi:hypothetical protein